MKDVRLKLTENEKIAQSVSGLENDNLNFNMSNDKKIKEIIDKENRSKFIDTVEEYVDKLDKHVKSLKESADKLGVDVSKLEIKPAFNRILITIFDKNPFQKITTTKTGIITDLGGLAPTHFNTDSGKKEEEDEQYIKVGVVQEVGPDVKYIKAGDTVFVDKNSIRPVPFYRQGFYCMSEQQVIAIVNEGLEDRFKEIQNG